jgi:diguanylate cyclase (GGDEF)-like protein
MACTLRMMSTPSLPPDSTGPSGDAGGAAAGPAAAGLQARRVYQLRMLATPFLLLIVGASAYQRTLSPWALGLLTLAIVLWPLLAKVLPRWSGRPAAWEQRNLIGDHVLAGMTCAVIGFNPLPSVLLMAMTGMSSMATGGTLLLLNGLTSSALGASLAVMAFGVRWYPESTRIDMLCSLPLLLVYPIAISHIAHQALRRLERRRSELEHISQHDGLSRLLNRTAWEKQVRAEFTRFQRTHEPVTLVMADLDHFKRINDEFGHAAGDEVIQRFAALLRKGLRSIDVPGRYGGEEFGILLPGTDAPTALQLLGRMRQRLHDEPLLKDHVVTASFGAVQLDTTFKRHGNWIRRADKMLYEAKHGGRDRIVVAVGMQASDAPGDAEPHAAERSAAGWKPHPDAPQVAAPSALPVLDIAVHAERAQLSLALLRTFEKSDMAVGLFDPQDRLVMANEALLRFYGPSALQSTMHRILAGIGDAPDASSARSQRGAGLEWASPLLARRRTVQAQRVIMAMAGHGLVEFQETLTDDGWLLQILEPAVASRPAAPRGGTVIPISAALAAHALRVQPMAREAEGDPRAASDALSAAASSSRRPASRGYRP